VTRYTIEEMKLMGVNFEKGHWIVVTPFQNIGEGWFGVFKMTLLPSGYAIANQIMLNVELATYTEGITRNVWRKLAEDGSSEAHYAMADEVRRVEVHKEHHPHEGDYSCDCGIDLQQAHVRAGQRIWRVHE